MKAMGKFWTTLAVVVFSTFLLTACGGGGGGGGTDQITYEGATNQATINSENAAELAELAYTGSELGMGDPPTIAAVETGNGQSAVDSAPLIPKLTDMLLALPNQLASSVSDSGNARTVISISQPSTECLDYGTVAISGSWDDVNGTMSATFTFNSCTENGETMSGSMGISASGLTTGIEGEPVFDNASISISYNNLTFVSAEENITVAGGITMTINGESVTLSMTMAMRDNSTGLLGKVEPYTVSVVDMGDHSEVSISGTVYRSDVGYVKLWTSETDPILVNDVTGEPYAGIYHIDGANGTWAEIDFSQQAQQGTWGDATGILGTFSI